MCQRHFWICFYRPNAPMVKIDEISSGASRLKFRKEATCKFIRAPHKNWKFLSTFRGVRILADSNVWHSLLHAAKHAYCIQSLNKKLKIRPVASSFNFTVTFSIEKKKWTISPKNNILKVYDSFREPLYVCNQEIMNDKSTKVKWHLRLCLCKT